MPKFERILNLFPSFYRATDRTKLLHEVVRKLAQPVEESDTHLFRIQRSHRLMVAEHADDVIRLAALLNLTAFHFEDILSDESMEYPKKLAFMRERVQRIAQVHLQGLGTPWAIMESAAIFLNARIVPERSGEQLIKHLDREMFSHKAVVEFSHLPGKPQSRIYLHENPLIRKKVEAAERWPMNSWIVENHNFGESQVKLAIQGIKDRTVLPGVFCPNTQEGIVFNGIVPDGKMLVIDELNGAFLDNQPVDEWMVYFKGAINNFSNVNSGSFSVAQGKSSTLFDGDLQKITHSPIRKRKTVPKAQQGRSQWYFKVAEGVYEGTDFDYSVYADSHEAIGFFDGDFNFNQCVFDYPASGIVGMAWNQHLPCAFKLLLPGHALFRQSKEADSEVAVATVGQQFNHISRVGNIMPRFKAAGIQTFVDIARDAWILGESIIRDPDAKEGEGADFQTTRLLSRDVDVFIPLE